MTQATALLRTLRRAPARPDESFAAAVLDGLAVRPRSIPARFFYDRAGSELFEAITQLPEYYLTRSETGLLAAHAAEIGRLVGPGRAMIEFGSGSSAKTPLLLEAVAPSAYVPIDISGEFLQDAAAALGAGHKGLPVLPVVGDFTQRLELPPGIHARPLMGFFPGSTIGNFTHAEAVDLLRAFRATLGADAWLVIGLDRRKDAARLHAAYDDAQGVTAAFNLNLLHRINRELDGTLPVHDFAHQIRWNEALGRIEMHLRAKRDIVATVLGRLVEIAAGDTIHTENSYKYTREEARLLAHASGWAPVQDWTDHEALFGLHVWRAASERLTP